MSVLAERHHDQQVAEHRHDNNDGEKDGENDRLQWAQEFLLLFLLLLSRVYYVIQQTAERKISTLKFLTHLESSHAVWKGLLL